MRRSISPVEKQLQIPRSRVKTFEKVLLGSNGILWEAVAANERARKSLEALIPRYEALLTDFEAFKEEFGFNAKPKSVKVDEDGNII